MTSIPDLIARAKLQPVHIGRPRHCAWVKYLPVCDALPVNWSLRHKIDWIIEQDGLRPEDHKKIYEAIGNLLRRRAKAR